MKVLNKFWFVQRKEEDPYISIFWRMNFISDTDYKRKKCIVLMKLKYNYFVIYR